MNRARSRSKQKVENIVRSSKIQTSFVNKLDSLKVKCFDADRLNTMPMLSPQILNEWDTLLNNFLRSNDEILSADVHSLIEAGFSDPIKKITGGQSVNNVISTLKQIKMLHEPSWWAPWDLSLTLNKLNQHQPSKPDDFMVPLTLKFLSIRYDDISAAHFAMIMQYLCKTSSLEEIEEVLQSIPPTQFIPHMDARRTFGFFCSILPLIFLRGYSHKGPISHLMSQSTVQLLSGLAHIPSHNYSQLIHALEKSQRPVIINGAGITGVSNDADIDKEEVECTYGVRDDKEEISLLVASKLSKMSKIPLSLILLKTPKSHADKPLINLLKDLKQKYLPHDWKGPPHGLLANALIDLTCLAVSGDNLSKSDGRSPLTTLQGLLGEEYWSRSLVFDDITFEGNTRICTRETFVDAVENCVVHLEKNVISVEKWELRGGWYGDMELLGWFAVLRTIAEYELTKSDMLGKNDPRIQSCLQRLIANPSARSRISGILELSKSGVLLAEVANSCMILGASWEAVHCFACKSLLEIFEASKTKSIERSSIFDCLVSSTYKTIRVHHTLTRELLVVLEFILKSKTASQLRGQILSKIILTATELNSFEDANRILVAISSHSPFSNPAGPGVVEALSLLIAKHPDIANSPENLLLFTKCIQQGLTGDKRVSIGRASRILTNFEKCNRLKMVKDILKVDGLNTLRTKVDSEMDILMASNNISREANVKQGALASFDILWNKLKNI